MACSIKRLPALNLKFKTGFFLSPEKFVFSQGLWTFISQCPSFDTFLDPTTKKFSLRQNSKVYIWGEHVSIFPHTEFIFSQNIQEFLSWAECYNTSIHNSFLPGTPNPEKCKLIFKYIHLSIKKQLK